MKERGVNLAWFDKQDKPTEVKTETPLYDTSCCGLSVYLILPNGDMYTTNYDGSQFLKVRNIGKTLPKQVYLCMKCKEQFKEYEQAKAHYESPR